MSARLLAWVLALALVAAGASARAAGVPSDGTKNFTPAPDTPSYFTGEPGLSYDGPREPPAPRGVAPRSPTAAAPAPASGDLYARPAGPAREAAVRRHWTRPAFERSWHYQSRTERARSWRLVRLHRWRALRLHRVRTVRLAHLRLRHERRWRR